MKVDKIMQCINLVTFEDVKEVIVPVDDLLVLYKEIRQLKADKETLRENLKRESIAHAATRADAFKAMANSEPILTRLNTYA